MTPGTGSARTCVEYGVSRTTPGAPTQRLPRYSTAANSQQGNCDHDCTSQNYHHLVVGSFHLTYSTLKTTILPYPSLSLHLSLSMISSPHLSVVHLQSAFLILTSFFSPAILVTSRPRLFHNILPQTLHFIHSFLANITLRLFFCYPVQLE
jgi:hypothetical protein